ncbi:MAG: hypothetical protein ABIJ00_02905 [Candidatus Eisenbacteria bacterium]
MHTRSVFMILLMLVAAVLVFQGCEQEELVRPDRNRPPETILSVGPDQGDRVFHKYNVRWTGLDEDGVVVEYWVASVAEDQLWNGRTSYEDIIEYMLDLPWGVTTKTESLFVFRADRPNSRNHSIYVQAVDNEGKADEIPAMVNFLAIDYGLPEVSICMAASVTRYSSALDDLVPPWVCAEAGVKGDTLPQFNIEFPGEPITVTLSWEGDDPDGEVVEWRYRLDSKSEVTVPADIKSTTLTYAPGNPAASDVWIGYHEFRLVAIDDANARSAEKVSRFVINYDPDTVIDSIWTFRGKVDNRPAETRSLPEKLVYAREWRETGQVPDGYDRVGFHFGQLRLKFHGTDKDAQPGGAPPDSFKWNISGTLLKSDSSRACGQAGDINYYCDISASFPYLDSDRPFRLYVTAMDSLGKADGSPDTIWFDVNTRPSLESLDADVLDAGSGRVKFVWVASDPDEGYGWGVATGETEQALMKYRYRIDNGQWREDGIGFDRSTNRFKQEVTVDNLDPGSHTFELVAYNGSYIKTRSDTLKISFGF